MIKFFIILFVGTALIFGIIALYNRLDKHEKEYEQKRNAKAESLKSQLMAENQAGTLAQGSLLEDIADDHSSEDSPSEDFPSSHQSLKEEPFAAQTIEDAALDDDSDDEEPFSYDELSLQLIAQDPSLTLLLSQARSDEEKEEILRFAKNKLMVSDKDCSDGLADDDLLADKNLEISRNMKKSMGEDLFLSTLLKEDFPDLGLEKTADLDPLGIGKQISDENDEPLILFSESIKEENREAKMGKEPISEYVESDLEKTQVFLNPLRNKR
ncbi:MAG: hypothetical protein RR396_00525 [Clostridiales bacterium]